MVRNAPDHSTTTNKKNRSKYRSLGIRIRTLSRSAAYTKCCCAAQKMRRRSGLGHFANIEHTLCEFSASLLNASNRRESRTVVRKRPVFRWARRKLTDRHKGCRHSWAAAESDSNNSVENHNETACGQKNLLLFPNRDSTERVQKKDADVRLKSASKLLLWFIKN